MSLVGIYRKFNELKDLFQRFGPMMQYAQGFMQQPIQQPTMTMPAPMNAKEIADDGDATAVAIARVGKAVKNPLLKLKEPTA